MNLCVYGLWHLGSVTAACLASLGHNVTGLDSNNKNIKKLLLGKAPIFEPGLDDLIKNQIKKKKLNFTSSIEEALKDSNIIWVTFDTPINEEDESIDTNYVLNKIKEVITYARVGSIFLISSQLPVGSIKSLEEWTLKLFPQKLIKFAYSPENLILGKSLKSFLQPDRIIVGIRNEILKDSLDKLLSTISKNIIWMSVESAEMVKHAINSFLAASIVFANEIAAICELVGADAKQVERGLKSEIRIGQKAYLKPGSAFAGGTLGRDIEFLKTIAKNKNIKLSLLESIKDSNDNHKLWINKKISENFSSVNELNVSIWGLTYKANTSTLRKSIIIDLCNWLIKHKANLYIHDLVIKDLPLEFINNKKVKKIENCLDMIKITDILIIGTEYDEYINESKNINNLCKKSLVIIDPNSFLNDTFVNTAIKYITVGSK
jgi:UDPglucose 6-dehydrogenase